MAAPAETAEKLLTKEPLPQGVPVSMPLGGSPKRARILSLVPQQLIGERITVYNRENECMQVGIIKNFDSIKKEHSVQLDSDNVVMLNLSECYWSQNVEESKEPPEQEKDANPVPPPEGDVPQVQVEEEGKGKRKRRPSTRQDQAMMDKLGSIQPKGRRPYRPGGCRIGKVYTDQDLVGSRVLMWSRRDSVYYAGGVKDFNDQTRMHTIIYLDGSTESLNMKDAIWRIATSDYDEVYPEDFTMKAREAGKTEKRKRRRAHIDPQNGFQTSAVEALLTLASSGSGLSSDRNQLTEPAPGSEQKVPVAASTGRSRAAGAGRAQRTNVSQDTTPRRMLPANTSGKDVRMRGDRREPGGDVSLAGDADLPVSAQGRGGSQKLVASSLEFQVHKVDTPDSGYHVLCSVPSGTRISDVHVTCGNACIIIEHGRNNNAAETGPPEETAAKDGCSRLVILLPEPIRPSSASAKLTQGGKLAVFTSLAV